MLTLTAVLVGVALITVLPLAELELLDKDLQVVTHHWLLLVVVVVVVVQAPLEQLPLPPQGLMVVLELLLQSQVNQSFTQAAAEAAAGKGPVLPLVVKAAEEMVVSGRVRLTDQTAPMG
jgi:hypothetical protein